MMPRGLLSLVFVFGFFWLSPITARSEEVVNPIKANVVLDPKEGSDGEFLIGVQFKIEPGWHLYWRYAGDTGLPTQIKFTLPDGGIVEELQWPTPIKFTQSGGLVGIGYEGEVVLFSRLKIPVSLSTEIVSLQARWVACSSKVCVPSKEEFTFKAADILSHKGFQVMDFEPWVKRVPLAFGSGEGHMTATSSKENASPKISKHEIVFDWKNPTEVIEWFPYLPRNLKLQNLRVETRGLKSVLTFDVERLDSEPLTQLMAEVVISRDGERLGLEHSISLN